MEDQGRALGDRHATEVAELIKDSSIVVQPIGSIEQHGPHLPLNTDLVRAEAAATAVVDAVGEELDLWLLPTLAYSKSTEHLWSPGTVSLSATTLLAVLDDIGRSVRRTAARRLVFLNAHGGNSALLNVACRELRIAYEFQTFVLHPALPVDQGGRGFEIESGMGVHGGMKETSILLYLRPDLVDMSSAQRSVPAHLLGYEHVRFGGPVSFGWTADDFGTSGVIGDPTRADMETGKELFDAEVGFLSAALREIATFPGPRSGRNTASQS